MTFREIPSWFRTASPGPLACVMGGMDLVRPLGLAGVRCAVVARPGSPSLYSRFTQAALSWDEFSAHDEALVEALVRFGSAQRERPILFFEEDVQLLLVSRNRERLGKAFRFAIADPDLVETLVDKSRFRALAQRIGLPVPTTREVRPATESPASLALRFPVIVKPLMRTPPWDALSASYKALQVDSPAALRELWSRLAALGGSVLVQELVPGPETRIESYHVYVTATGRIGGEFTGRKIRTLPVTCGHSTALEISDAADVMALGRALVAKLNLRGVAKLDFKRGLDGRLHLLEINPRFNLWHHLGAIAGVNLPALAYAELAGLAPPRVQTARAGARWCSPWKDLPAARMAGMSVVAWLPWMLGCEAKSAVSWDDPMPLLRAGLFRCLPSHGVGTTAVPFRFRKQAG